MDLITTHANTDFDALAAMVAAQKLYPEAVAVFPGAQEKNVRDFMKSSAWAFDIKKTKEVDLSEVSRLILVDTSSRKRIGSLKKLLDQPGLEIHIFDHHPRCDDDLHGVVEVLDQAASMSTVMVEILEEQKINITPIEATVLALGIYEETGFFSFSNTGEREFLAMARLIKHGANINIVNSFLGREPSREQIDLLNDLLQSSKEHMISGFIVQVAKASRENYIEDAAVVAHKLRDITDCDAIFILVRMTDRIHIIGRSRIPQVNVSKILSFFGGGGHAFAASAVSREGSLEKTEEELLCLLKKKIRPQKTARDIMTSPVKTIPYSATIREAEKALARYSFSVMPIVKEDKEAIFMGVISREVVERALHHGFSDRKVLKFATTDPVSAGPNTSIREVEMLMVERNRKFLPVLKHGRVVGAITRTDLLRVLYEDMLRKDRLSGEEYSDRMGPTRNVQILMQDKFPKERFMLLELCGEVARQMGYNVYLVGGSVRDLLRNKSNLDLDVVVEGHGISFAKKLAAKINGRVRSHHKFNTAVIVLPDGFKLDIATARTEYYESPAVLPTVEASSIKKDLYRRDFTINTLAVKLNKPGFGTLIDFFGGRRDLKDCTIRILHNLSFVEDPTRAFRAIRFAERFDFHIGKHTANLIKTAVKMNLFESLSGSRLYDELMLLFRETRPASAVKALERFGLLSCVHPSIKCSPGLLDLFEKLEKVVEWYHLMYLDEPIMEGVLYLIALLNGLKEEQAAEVVERLKVPPRAGLQITRTLKQSRAALHNLCSNLDARTVYYALSGFDLETLVFTMAQTDDEEVKKALSMFITELRHSVPLLSGKELKAMGYKPGRLYHKIFKALLDARLEGRVKTKYDETLFVREEFGGKFEC